MARRVELIYGPSGAGKTTFLLMLARYLFETTGKHTRWYLGDGGGETIYNSGLADPGGFIQVYHYNLRPWPLETTQLIVEGWWPADISDVRKLVAPTREDLERVGLWIFEGLTVMSDYIMGDQEGGLAYRMGRGETLNKDESYMLKDGTMKFGGNARTHFGFTQRRILELVRTTWGLPGLVYFSAHERRVDDEESRETLFGPDVCGKALTSRIGGSFGNTLHLQKVHVTQKVTDQVTKKQVEKVVLQRRLYTQEHMDPEAKTFVKYYANTRLPEYVAEEEPTFMPEYLTPPDPVAYYRRLQEAQVRNEELRQARQAKAKDQAPVVLI